MRSNADVARSLKISTIRNRNIDAFLDGSFDHVSFECGLDEQTKKPQDSQSFFRGDLRN